MNTTVSEKLDLLMKLTGTKNSTLARALNFDASYISRLRSGQRGLPHSRGFIEPAADFFARNLTMEYQATAAADAICPGEAWPERLADASARIAAWLSGGDDSPAREPGAESWPAEHGRSGKTFFYGNAGKREAVTLFLSQLCALPNSATLLLYSNEEMAWLYEDTDFARRWAELLGTLLQRDWKIRVVHSVGRDITEMLEAVEKWSPLYMLGDIEPYYCPKLRDNIFRQTRFIAKGISAVISSSVGEHPEEMVNLLIDNVTAVRAIEREFAGFLTLCRPLMQIYRRGDAKRLRYAFGKFMDANDAPLMGASFGDTVMLAREGVGAFVLPAGTRGAVFQITEPQLTASIWEFLNRAGGTPDPKPAAARLESYIAAIS